MKIDTDLRLAIKSAEKTQPRDDWRARDAAIKASIDDLFQRKPAIAFAVRKLVAKARKAEAAQAAATKELCEKYGLRHNGDELQFAGCGESQQRFEKIGGKIQQKHTIWSFDAVMRELATATPAEGAKIIKRLGIVWE